MLPQAVGSPHSIRKENEVLIEKIMWYFDCTREEAEKLYDTLTDTQKVEVDMSYYAWTHNIDY